MQNLAHSDGRRNEKRSFLEVFINICWKSWEVYQFLMETAIFNKCTVGNVLYLIINTIFEGTKYTSKL